MLEVFILTMFVYVFESTKWIETKKLYPHDIALILNPSEKTIYFWEGPRSKSDMKEEASALFDKLISKYPNFKFTKLEKDIPQVIEEKIDMITDKSYETMQKFDRSPIYSLYFYTGLMCMIFPLIAYSFIFSPLGWNLSTTDPGMYSVSEVNYSAWVQISSNLVFTSIVLFIILTVFSFFTMKIFLITTSFIGVAVEFGVYFYVNLGVYLFDFQGTSLLEPPYQILISDVIIYCLLNLFSLLVILLPLIISLRALKNSTIPISWKDWKSKKEREKEIFEVKKLSILSRKTQFIPFDPNNPDKEYSQEEIEKLNL
jgi:hypothetical protein